MNLIARSVVVSCVILIVSSAAASAIVSYHGDDYSFDYNAKTYIKACDMESDGNEVKGNYDFNNSGDASGSVIDGDGNNGVCASKNTAGTIVRHRTCEAINFWPDSCGNWQAP
jgi:hypothetical protein